MTHIAKGARVPYYTDNNPESCKLQKVPVGIARTCQSHYRAELEVGPGFFPQVQHFRAHAHEETAANCWHGSAYGVGLKIL